MFNSRDADKLLSLRPELDYTINLISGVTPIAKRMYGSSKEQTRVIKIWIDDMYGKGFIRRSISEYAVSLLCVSKPGGGIRICVDYRVLNEITIRNRNALSLMRDTLFYLVLSHFYSKFDVIVIF